ncbi:MAG: ABC transporter ATP-binding protein [Tissierellia bacterium]|jgi:ABC-2 type transport system ATP-binding protein|nr:ABC transporter ATP-binding protein [Tissierellia bacterium]MDD3226648.1 ABC transporter ATP-binding protein [Tissierellia bacterium]MDD3750998.1 ABC transporter ATP-binding protein [Tissierellia bacterium]MDD4046313.1 ABC transporter ATP-binding protein [Tissierellia bacterium]
MLTINNLSKKFGDFQVLEDININAEKGQIYGLVGSNGCGKTTTLKHIMKVYKQDEGYITFDGEEVDENSGIIKYFYYVQDTLYFPYQYTLNKLFHYEKLMYNMSEEKFEYLLKYFNIDKNKVLNKMSKGQKKQAAFILSIAAQPKLLLLDEIVDGLDAVIKRKFWDVLIKEVMDNEMTVIISSHDLKELDNICDKVGIMHEGKILREENLEKMKEDIKRVQFAVEGEFDLEELKEFNILQTVKIGSVFILTLTGNTDELKKHLESKYTLLLFDKLSMSLEEIFITELGGVGYGKEK